MRARAASSSRPAAERQRFVGEHYGYERLEDPVVHRREIVFDPRRQVDRSGRHAALRGRTHARAAPGISPRTARSSASAAACEVTNGITQVFMRAARGAGARGDSSRRKRGAGRLGLAQLRPQGAEHDRAVAFARQRCHGAAHPHHLHEVAPHWPLNPRFRRTQLHQVVTADVQSAERTHALQARRLLRPVQRDRRHRCRGAQRGRPVSRRRAAPVAPHADHRGRCGRCCWPPTPREDNVLLTVNLTNPDVRGEGGRVVLPRGTLHITRSRFIWDGVCHEMIRVRNFALNTVGGGTGDPLRLGFREHRRRARAAARRRRPRALRARRARQRHAGLSRRRRSRARDRGRLPHRAGRDFLRQPAVPVADRQPRRKDHRARHRLPLGEPARCRSPRSRVRWPPPRSWRAPRAGRRRRWNPPTRRSTPGCSAPRPTSA